MAPTELKIVGMGMDYRAPTGEGRIYRTEDGRHWRELPVSNFTPSDKTGREVRWKVGDRLVPWNTTVGT